MPVDRPAWMSAPSTDGADLRPHHDGAIRTPALGSLAASAGALEALSFDRRSTAGFLRGGALGGAEWQRGSFAGRGRGCRVAGVSGRSLIVARTISARACLLVVVRMTSVVVLASGCAASSASGPSPAAGGGSSSVVAKRRGHQARPGRGGLVASSASALVVQPQPPAGSCHVRARGLLVLPDPACTPGAVNPQVTQATIGETICGTSV